MVLTPNGQIVTDIYEDVNNERERAHALHGFNSMEGPHEAHDPYGVRKDILIEEIGEVSKEFNEARIAGRAVDLKALRKELIQVAAMACAWADAIDEALR
jgi:hypothetical protein